MAKLSKTQERIRKDKIVSLLADDNLSYNEIANRCGVTRRYVMDVLQEQLSSLDSPEKILELREQRSQSIISQSNKLYKNFSRTSKITTNLIDKYDSTLDEEEKYKRSKIIQEFLDEGFELEEAEKMARLEINDYYDRRERIAREMERSAKVADMQYRTILEHEKRLSNMHGLDAPKSQEIFISRTDTLHVELEQELLAQKALSSPIVEAETIEDDIVQQEDN